jgi:dolichol-phosphate mannosyltransferase
MTFGFGFVFLMIGVIAEYLWRMFDQVRPRPRFIVEETFELGK